MMSTATMRRSEATPMIQIILPCRSFMSCGSRWDMLYSNLQSVNLSLLHHAHEDFHIHDKYRPMNKNTGVAHCGQNVFD